MLRTHRTKRSKTKGEQCRVRPWISSVKSKLGLSTIIDLVVFFFFTKPLVTLFARLHFFNGGGKLSGLSAETLGIDKIAADRPRVAPATRTSGPSTAGGGTA